MTEGNAGRLSLAVTILVLFAACQKSDAPSNPSPSASTPVVASAPQTPPPPPPDVAALSTGVVLRLSVELVHAGRAAKVQAETNLPDSTEIMLTIREPGDFGINHDSKTAVQGGRFSVIGTGPDNAGLEDGEYIAEALMPVPSAQPGSVQTLLGDGSGLKGPLVHRDEIGTTVFSSTRFVVGANRDAAIATGEERRRRTKAAVLAALKQYQQIVQRGRTADRSDGVSCMSRARADWASLDPHKEELEKLSFKIPGVTGLRGAWLLTHNCAACTDRFLDACNDASDTLREAASDIAEGKLK